MSADDSIESFTVPMDVKVEVFVGLLLCVLGLTAIYTTDLLIIQGLHLYDCK